MGLLSAIFGKREPSRPRRVSVICAAKGYPLDVVGEAFFQENLKALCGGYSRHGHEIACEAEIRPEPSNQHDPNAMQVLIRGRPVGYLDREQAVRFRSALQAAGLDGVRLTCSAQIRGGWRTNQHDAGHFGVKLAAPRRGELAFG